MPSCHRPRLVLLCGLPGSGKTTEATRIAHEYPAVQLTSDRWLSDLGFDGWDTAARERVEKLQWSLAQELLQLGLHVVLESGFWSRAERNCFRARAREIGALVELRFLDVPVAELNRRLERRNADVPYGSFHVTPTQLAEMLPLFEAPDADELALFDPPLLR